MTIQSYGRPHYRIDVEDHAGYSIYDLWNRKYAVNGKILEHWYFYYNGQVL